MINSQNKEVHMHEQIKYNPLQKATAKYIDKDCNLVCLAPTSSGKTIVAEQFLFSTIEAGARAIYLSPLKALTEEKRHEWEKTPYSLLVVTGDHARPTSFRYDLIAMTTEALDSKTRSSKAWLKKVGCIVIDEAHILGMAGRGDALEVGLMSFTDINKHARLIFLSATIPNVQDIAAWATKLNGKPTEIVETDYRPVTQEHHFMAYYGHEKYLDRHVVDIANAVDVSKQILIFVHTIRKGQALARLLNAPFHFSKLSRQKRAAIEEAFRERKIRRLVATSTLAYGVNLPADVVIIAGRNRGPELVDIWDIKQMAGRAGRLGLSETGEVYYVMPHYLIDDLKEELSNIHPVKSVLNERLYFHICSWIYRSGMQRREMQVFLQKAFAEDLDLDSHLRLLSSYDIVQEADGVLSVNNVGKAAAMMYLNPIDLHHLKTNLKEQPTDPREIARAFADIPLYSIPCYLPHDMQEDIFGFGAKTKTIIATSLFQWLSGTDLTPTASVTVPRLVADIKRWTSALAISGLQKSYVKLLELMLMHGVPSTLHDLVKIPGIGRKRAKRLWDHGIKTLEDAMSQPQLTVNIVGRAAFERIKTRIENPGAIFITY